MRARRHDTRLASSDARWLQWRERDRDWSRRLYSASRFGPIVRLLGWVSVLSDGIVWYVTMAALPWIAGPRGSACMWRMLVLGLVNVTIYKITKRFFARPRPFTSCDDIQACAKVLDEYSFPSGHTLHAVAFSLVLCTYWPALGWLLWPFAILVALSRIVLGLHYPSDVAAGAAIGWLAAEGVLMLL